MAEKRILGVFSLRTSDDREPDGGALADVFGVEPSYLLDRCEPALDGELVEALRSGPAGGS